MDHRLFLLPGGTWTILATANPRMLPDHTIMVDPWTTNPGHRVRELHGGTWSALTEQDIDRLYSRLQGMPANLKPPI